MAGRGRATFQKRKKEQMRLEKRQEKAARKEARKANKEPEPGVSEDGIALGRHPAFDDDYAGPTAADDHSTP